MKRPWQAERGVMAIEMTIVLALGTFILAAVVLVGRLTWHAIAMQKAVSSAGRIVSTLSFETLTASGVTVPLHEAISEHINAATRSAGLDLQPEQVEVFCVNSLPRGCGRTFVTFVAVGAYVRFRDTIFDVSLTEPTGVTDIDLPVGYYQTYVR